MHNTGTKFPAAGPAPLNTAQTSGTPASPSARRQTDHESNSTGVINCDAALNIVRLPIFLLPSGFHASPMLELLIWTATQTASCSWTPDLSPVY